MPGDWTGSAAAACCRVEKNGEPPAAAAIAGGARPPLWRRERRLMRLIRALSIADLLIGCCWSLPAVLWLTGDAAGWLCLFIMWRRKPRNSEERRWYIKRIYYVVCLFIMGVAVTGCGRVILVGYIYILLKISKLDIECIWEERKREYLEDMQNKMSY